MQYADYEYYTTVYGGARVPAGEFTRLSRQASAYVDAITYGKICGNWLDDERVKDACCAVADEMYQQDQGGDVTSESNDGTSVTYASSSTTPKQRMRTAASTYLTNTGLLYAGIR